MKRRLLALLLVLSMLLPTIPMGTLAEEEEAQTDTQVAEDYTLSATAKMTPFGWDGVEVLVTGSLLLATKEDPVYVVAAYFDWSTGKMVDADYAKVTDPSAGMCGLHLYNTPEYGEINVFVLDSGLQSLTWNSITADWEESDSWDSQEQPTEETKVPEETEETVPEQTEEAVPEETEQEVIEELEEGLTSEEAAQEGYYVAPEGAQLQESADLEEMAAYVGTDKASKGLHTATFTGLAPEQAYTFLVSATPGSLEDLKYIWLTASDANGEASFSYVPKDEGAAVVQLYGPEALTLAPEKEYLTLQPGKEVQIRLVSNGDIRVQPILDEAADEALNVSVDEQDDTLFTVSIKDAFLEKLQQVESRYISFVGYAGGQMAGTKVRVDLIPADSQVEGAALGETTVTHNYYSTEATAIPVFLEINVPDQGSTVDTQAAFDGAEDTGLIRKVEFSKDTDGAVKNAFSIRVQDDHTLLLRTKESEGENIDLSTLAAPQNLKSSYNVGFQLTVNDNGQEKQIPVKGTLKLNIQKKLPTLKAESVTLNTIAKPTGIVNITGGEVKKLTCSGSDLVTLDYDSAYGTVTARLRKGTTKSSTVNLTANVWVVGYSQPVTVKVPVKIEAKVPTLKLEWTTWDLCSIANHWDSIPVLCTTNGVDVADLTFDACSVQDSKGRDLSAYYDMYIENGVLNMYSYGENRPLGKQDLVIKTNILASYPEGEEEVAIKTPVSFKLTVNNQETGLKLNKTTANLNVWMAAGITLKATITGIPEGWVPFTDYGVSYNISSKHFPDATEYFELKWDGDSGLFLEPKSSAIEGLGDSYVDFLQDTFTLSVGIEGTDENKWAKVAITLAEDMPALASVKASGTIDVNNDNTYVTLTPTFKDGLSVGSMDVAVTDADGAEYRVIWNMDGDKILVSRAPEEENLKPGTYTATVTAYWFDLTTTASTTFKVIEKKPTVKTVGKLDSSMDTELHIIPSYVHNGLNGEPMVPTVTITGTGKNAGALSDELYVCQPDYEGGLWLYPATYGDQLMPAGKYTVKLDYGNGVVLSTPITVTQTVGNMKLSKSSVTLHPQGGQDGVYLTSTYTGMTGYSDVALYQSNGKTLWNGKELINVDFAPDSYVNVTPTGNVPDRDTTIKVKLTPDKRMPGKFTWLTVKVLGGKSLNKKLTLKAVEPLDPSYSYASTQIRVTVSGFDNKYFDEDKGTITLLESTDKGKTYHEVNKKAYEEYSIAYSTGAFLGVADYWDESTYQRVIVPNPNYKYRVRVSYGAGLTGTLDLKVAYGKNKFTVAKAPTLYKKDPQAELDIHIDQENMEQQIDHITIKGKSDFEIWEAAGLNDWTIRYTGTAAKLKTTTLPLQIFLRGNNTTKPNATLNVKVTVK